MAGYTHGGNDGNIYTLGILLNSFNGLVIADEGEQAALITPTEDLWRELVVGRSRASISRNQHYASQQQPIR